MFSPVRMVDIELSRRLRDIDGLESYGAVRALVRVHGTPIGYVTVPVGRGRCAAPALAQAIAADLGTAIARRLSQQGSPTPPSPDRLLENLVGTPPPGDGIDDHSWPPVTVAVCTRDRPDSLAGCLDALIRLDYPHLDLMVVDNAPTSDRTRQMVVSTDPRVRYVCEPRPGLDWARNRAIQEARTDIIAYTDDDVVVDPGWVRALARAFAGHRDVMAVTGLVVPYELETEAQMLFERYCGFGRGFERKEYRLDRDRGARDSFHLAAAKFGTGANMAFRRSLFERIGGFDPALDVGTVTNGGGDLEMFFRVVQEGHALMYEPAAIVRHRHRREWAALRTQLTHNAIGFNAYLVRSALAYPGQRRAIIRYVLRRQWRHLRRWLASLMVPPAIPRDLILAELRGALIGVVRYHPARRTASKIAREFGRSGSPHLEPAVHDR